MPRRGKTLTDVEVRRRRPLEAAYNLYDTGGLYVTVSPTGSKWWRLKYQFAGKERRIGLGTYPEVSLPEARRRRDEARAQLRSGVDPGQKRKADKIELRQSVANSFEVVGREWLAKQSATMAPTTVRKATALLEKWAFPWIGSRPIADISARELLETVLRRVEGTGKLETVHRLKQRCGQIFRYAIATGRADRNPVPDLQGALTAQRTRNYPTITDPTRIGQLLRDIDRYSGQFTTLCALKLSALLFVRPGELRTAEWSEIDLEVGMWSIPAEKMKMNAPHLVPLAEQAVSILRDLRPLTGDGAFVFPAAHTRKRPMSENTVNVALRRLGYGREDIVAHGFRSMASTLLNEQGWPPDVIERQLAHAERNEVRRAYNRAIYLPERKKMMQAWADYLDALRRGAEVIPIGRKAG